MGVAASVERRVLPIRNPRTGQADYQITPPTAAELLDICRRLREGQKAWGAASLEHRIQVMRQWVERLKAHSAELAEADSVDTGYCAISRMSPGIVIGNVLGWSSAAPNILERARLEGRSSIMPNIAFSTELRPYPLLGVISPWNAPLMLSLIDAVPALFAGCAVIIKPSEVTPRFVEPLMRSIAEVPELASVLSYVVGDAQTGQEIIENVDILCFTGSVPNGRKVAEACAKRFIPVFLELGGKDPVIVTETADLDRAATAVLRGAVFGTGQVCFSVERIYVHEKVHDAFVDRLVKKAEQVVLNYPDIARGHIGPFVFARQAEIVDAHLDDAVQKGATILTGGKSQNLGGGLYMRPTVLTNVTHGMKIMKEETFGPVMPVMKYKTEEEAVRLANDTIYGLSAAVIAGTEEEARRIGKQIKAGTITLQDTFLTLAKTRDVESNAFNFSGMGGARTGPGSITRFLRKQAFLTNTTQPADLTSAT
ncbi:MAG TPA: aldehyde dehydrogenase family protein [Candidatus Polarisedimenticolia bacterium]|nr:aldehyde dehydrogenase family protein [Candidatus Polarisedimenticolia bacterium]